MERATRDEKKKFLRERDFLSNQLSSLYSQVNQANNDYATVKINTDKEEKK